MKKFIAICLVILFSLSLASCGTINASAGKYAFLMPEKGGVVKETRSKMVFYVLWGLVPVTSNSTADLVQPKEKVRIKTSMSFVDCLLTMLLGIATIQVRSAEVEVLQ